MTQPIRVALSGSGFRLCAHIGALQAIVDAGFEVIEIAGTSGGSIVAALFASGMDLEEMHDLCMSTDWSPMMGASLAGFLEEAMSTGHQLLNFLMDKTGGKTFADLPIELKVIASDLSTNREYVFCRDETPAAPIAFAARASASIPFVYAPVLYGDAVLVDGGCADNVPTGRLTVDAVPRCGIYLRSSDPPPLNGKHGLLDTLPRVIDLMLTANEGAHVQCDTLGGAAVVEVQTGYASSFDRNMPAATRMRLHSDGYAATQRNLVENAAALA
ncbi:patatin-like phospholipase family protein [Pararobbsia silviterrae]|uniref:Exotoxin n=1 Tax=Pararobbsia silviterrae TaxID=1792498 RepID=A0A494X2C6_9BURK|nr:patatin-like phospholipase family protein [Pararobbsia silviterrae]RKP43781.1 exotoxin [Pararobbsia silviterrae]